MKKKIISFFICIIFIFVFTFNSFAASYSVYSSVSPSTSQVTLLINTAINQKDFSVFKDWICFRTGDYDYSLFYNIDSSSGTARRIRYYATQSGYNNIWHLTFNDESNFSYYSNNYTIVGNISDSLGSELYNNYKQNVIFQMVVPAILMTLLFFVFRIRKGRRDFKI